MGREWDLRRAAYECRLVLQRADEKYGRLADAQDEKYEVEYQIKRQFGTLAPLQIGEDAAEQLAVARRVEQEAGARWLNEMVTPTEDAAIALLLTPAPDVEAVRFKAQMIEDQELHALLKTPRDCGDVLREDIARLGVLNA